MAEVIPGDCLRRAAESLGGPFTQERLGFVQDEIARIQATLLSSGVASSPANALMLAARKFGQQQQLAARIMRRNAAINANTYFHTLAYITTTWKGREAEGLRAVLTGSIEGREGARASAALEQKLLLGQYLGGINAELERGGLIDAFRHGALDRDVTRALWQLNTKGGKVTGPKDAVAIAKVIHKYQELARGHANKAGAWIGKTEGWVTRQSHDWWKISRVSFADWAKAIYPKLDWSRIEAQHGPIKNRQAFLRDVHTGLASGVHIQAKGATNTTGFKGPRNIAKGMSAERVLHFKSADDWFDYNEQFGTGNLRESVFVGLVRTSQNTGLMRQLGTNPEAMMRRLVDEVGRRVDARQDPKALKEFSDWTKPGGKLWNHLAEVDGTVNIPVAHTAARVASNLRAWQAMAKLGGAVISSVTDIATSASEFSYQGRGFLNGMGEAIAGVGAGRPKGERQEILASLGVFFESMTSSLTREGSLDESFGGWTSRSMQQFFKWNLLNWWTESLRGSAALSMSHYLAANAGKVWGRLPPDLKRVLSLYKINAQDWDHMRAAGVMKAADGRAYMVPDGLDERRAGMLRQYVVDRAYQAVIEPDAGTRAAFTRHGTRPGTFQGELLRFVMQFKGYPVAFARQVLGREIYGRGAQAFGEGSVLGLAQIIAATTVMGYGAMAAKDALKGKKPRDPSDYKTILAAMVQGGGAGIYGDFLFGEFNRFGRSPLESLAGPVAGTGEEVVQMWAKLIRGEADGGQALRMAFNNTPYLNLFYARPVLDYAILYNMQEAVSPGTLRRLERNAKKTQGQEYWLPPSTEAVGQ